jgi:hypothetical protein
VSYLENNLECGNCDFFEHEVFYKRSEGPPACPECGGERKMSFVGLRFAVHGQGPGSFVPIDFGVLGKAETKEDYDRCIKTIEDRFPGHHVEIESENQQKWQQRTDERLQKQYERRKARGNDSKMVNEIATERRILRKEAKVVAKANPQPAKSK